LKAFLKEFKEFAMRGNVMDLAVGMIIGAAFTGIVSSMTDDILSPIIGLLFQADFSNLVWNITGDVNLKYGSFLMAVINFLIVAFCLFVLVKAMNKAMSFGRKPEEEAVPTTKICPFCKTEIDVEATRCPHCTSQLEEPTESE